MKKEAFDDVLGRRSEIEKNEARVLELSDEIHEKNEERSRLEAELTSLLPWESFGVPLDLKETGRCTIDLGLLPIQADLDAFRQDLDAAADTQELWEVGRDREYIYLALIAEKHVTDQVRDIAKQHGWTDVPFQGLSGSAADNISRIREKIAEKEQEIHIAEEKISGRYSERDEIECLHDALVIERDKEAMKGELLRTERTFLFEGWVPEAAEKKTQKILDRAGCYYVFRDPEEDERPPVLMKNNAFVTPFESITEMYSLPDYRGIDPTKEFSLFYAMFFGIMLSDAGYGIVLTIATAVVLKKFDLEGNLYKMIRMFFYCGISTIFWGAMFGGWFGNIVSVVGETFFHKDVSLPPIWFDPIQDPTKLLIFSLFLGVIHIFVALGLNAYMSIRDGHWFDAICDDVSWYMVITGAGLLLVFSDYPTVKSVGKWVMIAGFVLLLVTGGRKSKGFGKVLGGLNAVYGVTGYISDILSYARLLALGLATGVIAQVINTIGGLAGGGVKGAIVMIVVFVIGHIFNILINALGAFVHSSRLQYIEFFGKFYIDGGDPFQPFRRNTKYIRFAEEANEGGNEND